MTNRYLIIYNKVLVNKGEQLKQETFCIVDPNVM